MLYSSGTTGQAQGHQAADASAVRWARPTSFGALLTGLYGIGEGSVYLSPAPLYHAAPAGWTNAVHRLGGTVVRDGAVRPRGDPRLIEAHRVTHVQFVPTHLVRLLKLPDSDRDRFDLSSLQVVVHAAAPCPPEVKRAAIEWLGPIVYEYYSGSEGVGFCAIGPEEWLAPPRLGGPVHAGRRRTSPTTRATSSGPNQVGQVWFETPTGFEYHGDAEKTAEAFDRPGWSSLGDMGRLDEDGYLYLTDRVSNMIISGGVNIYPREVEDVLIAASGRGGRGRRRRFPTPTWANRSGPWSRCRPTLEDPAAVRTELIEYCTERPPVQVPAVGGASSSRSPGCPRASWPSACSPARR